MGQADIPHYTYNDWLHWEGRWELIEGRPVAMSPLPLPKHQRVAAEIRTGLTLALRKSDCKTCRSYDPLDFKISDDTILQPDVLVVCGNIEKPFLDFPPSLVVEILSPSTALRDRNTKYQIYEQQGLKYYLIVDADKKTIEAYELENDKYKHIQTETSYFFNLTSDCSISPNFTTIWD